VRLVGTVKLSSFHWQLVCVCCLRQVGGDVAVLVGGVSDRAAHRPYTGSDSVCLLLDAS